MLAFGCFFLIFQQAKAMQGAVLRAQGSAKYYFPEFPATAPEQYQCIFRSYDPHIFPRANTVETVCRQLNQRPATSHYINKLFRTFRSAHRPKAAPYATSHYYNMIIHTCYSPVKKYSLK